MYIDGKGLFLCFSQGPHTTLIRPCLRPFTQWLWFWNPSLDWEIGSMAELSPPQQGVLRPIEVQIQSTIVNLPSLS